MNYISLLIIEAWPNFFFPFDMTMLSSGLFALIIIGLFYLMRLSTKKGRVLPYFILLFALTTVFQLKEINAIFDFKEVFWYATYNTHMWAIFILQISYAYCWLQSINKNKIENYSKGDLLLFAFIQVICAYITFHYKISFFVASGAIAGSLFFFFSHRIKIRYVITYSLLFLALIFMTWLLSDYSYLAYFQRYLSCDRSTKRARISNDRLRLGSFVWKYPVNHCLGKFSTIKQTIFCQNTNPPAPTIFRKLFQKSHQNQLQKTKFSVGKSFFSFFDKCCNFLGDD